MRILPDRNTETPGHLRLGGGWETEIREPVEIPIALFNLFMQTPTAPAGAICGKLIGRTGIIVKPQLPLFLQARPPVLIWQPQTLLPESRQTGFSFQR